MLIAEVWITSNCLNSSPTCSITIWKPTIDLSDFLKDLFYRIAVLFIFLRRSSCINYYLHDYNINVPYFYSPRARSWYFACFLLSIAVCFWFAHSTMRTIWHVLFRIYNSDSFSPSGAWFGNQIPEVFYFILCYIQPFLLVPFIYSIELKVFDDEAVPPR